MKIKENPSSEHPPQNTSKKRGRLILLAKLLIFVLLAFSIYRKLVQNDQADEMFLAFRENLNNFPPENYVFCLGVLLLMILNWSIEAIKWRLLISKVEKMSFFRSLKAICCGITLAMFTPNRIGDFGGRVLLLQKASKMEGIAITLVGSLSQIVASFSIGLLGWMIFYQYFTQADTYTMLVLYLVSGLLIGFLGLFYFNIKWLKNAVNYFSKWNWLRKKQHYFNPVVHYSIKDLTLVLLLSVFRHFVFSFQYWLLFQILGIEVSLVEGMILILSIFFMQTIIPSIAIVELGIRGKVALYFMDFVKANQIAVLTAAFLLWGINLLFPALIGMLIIFSLKINVS